MVIRRPPARTQRGLRRSPDLTTFPVMRPVLRTLARTLTWLGMCVVLLLCLVAGALWLTLPPSAQEIHIPGLSAPVEISFDQDGIPRIRAESALDGAAALGFVHARDRLFQMELMRRNASGRLSEIAGAPTLPLDRMMRTLGLRRRAVADLAALPDDARAMLEAYARGVNAWIEARGRFAAPEFLVLGAPEPWQPVDSLLWGKTMGLWLSSNWRTELSRLELTGRVPQQLIDQLWPTVQSTPGPAAAGPESRRFGSASDALERLLPGFPGPFTLPSTASNEWAVDGRHTASGAPLLAGDPHLALGFPAIWYLARLETPGHVLAGATAPGIPFLVLGHNGHVAWTFTTTGADVQDVFVETQVGSGDYQTPDGPRPFAVREERIKVRGQADEILTVRETRHGPVVSDLLGKDGPLLAVAMGNLQPNDTAAAGLLNLNRAETVAQVGEVAPMITSPVQNLLVADRQAIGLFLTGRVPLRRAGDGSAPVSGDGSHDWIGWASGSALPHIVAPESGRLVNANEPVTSDPSGPGGRVFLGRDAFGDWRARRIRDLLAASDRHTAADFAHIQTDVRSEFARQILPALLAVSGAGEQAMRAQALLRDWDGSMTVDAPQPLIFNAWVDQFDRAVLRQAGVRPSQGGPMLDFVAFILSRKPIAGPGPDARLRTDQTGVAHGHDQATAQWCDGDCPSMLKAALEVAVQTLRDEYGPDPAQWRWGTAHQAVFAHPVLRQIPLIGALAAFQIAAPGDDSTVDRGGTDSGLQDVHGAAYRGVYDLADLDRSLFVVAPGQSGHMLSRHARDFLARWRDGATVALGPLALHTEAALRLTP
jgi:penicillin amidase